MTVSRLGLKSSVKKELDIVQDLPVCHFLDGLIEPDDKALKAVHIVLHRVRRVVPFLDAVIHTYPRSKASKKYKEIAEKILGRKSKNNSKKRGFFARLFGRD